MDGCGVEVVVGSLSRARVCLHRPGCKGQEALLPGNWASLHRLFKFSQLKRGSEKNDQLLSQKHESICLCSNNSIHIKGLLTLAILAILVACSDGVHTVAGGAVCRRAV